MTLYHYTCQHGFEAIRADGWVLKPNRLAPLIGLPTLVWLTDMDTPDMWALGLTNEMRRENCDRTQFRLKAVDTQPVLQWSKWCRAVGFTRAQRDVLEWGKAQPRRWYVSPVPIQAEMS